MKFSVTPPIAGTGGIILGPDPSARDRAYLGRLAEAGPIRRVDFDLSSESVIALFGKRGSGKSYTLGLLAEALASRENESHVGGSTRTRGCLLLDTLNVFWSLETPLDPARDADRLPTEVAALRSWRIEPPSLSVQVWVPAGFRNSYTPQSYRDFAVDVSELSQDDVCDLFDVDAQRDTIGQLLCEVRDKAHAARPGDVSFEQMLQIVEGDADVASYYAESTVRAARQRLRSVAGLKCFASGAGTRLRDLLVPGSVAVLELGDLPNSLRAVIASVLLRRIHSERARASEAEKQLRLNPTLTESERQGMRDFLATAIPPSWVMIDEAQNVLPGERAVKSTDAVVRFVREGRNFGLSMALTSQQPAAVDQRILAQADTMICHRLTVAADLARVRQNLKSPEPQEIRLTGRNLDLDSWLRSLEPGHAVITNTDSERLLPVEFRPRVSPHAGSGFRLGESA